ncbi:FecR domain-containing protein [Cupriavidus sp. WGlv3]|uniref:FecR domain-containing protein n=1 Tax=Cupriavidus sp. WGlv3 TaxID=2919924 RepID=UPI00209079AB|nr:FecR domain-containing protein [Cupriavidus sp. WGlv3]MCO4860998.1 FecR domain-containing protein [Cupriavidus sp. WGlv3]
MRRVVRGIALALLAGAAVPAQAGPAGAQGADFIYVVEPGDTLIGLASRYMASEQGWRTLQRLNGVADPYRLVPGSRVRIPLAQIPEQAASARVVYVSGGVRANGRPVQVGMTLDEAARIETPAGGSATLELPDRTRVTLPPATTVAVNRLRTFTRSGLVDTVIRIDQGAAETRVAPEGGGVGRFEMHTPMMVTGVRGTRYRVSADAGGSRSEVLQGRVGVSAARARMAAATAAAPQRAMTAAASLEAGYGIAVSAGGRLSQPVALLPAPALLPPDQTVLGPSFEAAWQPVPGAVAYRVRVARDAALSELVWTGTASGADAARVRVEGLPEGTLYLSVSAIDRHQLTGHDAQAPVSVRLNPPAPFTQQPAADAVRYADAVSFEWATVPAAASYELALATDAAFTRDAAVHGAAASPAARALAPGRWWWRVRSVDAAGLPGPWSDAVPFRVEPKPPVPTLQDDGGALHIGWPDGGGGPGYRVQLAAEAGFATLLADEHTATNAIDLPRPAPGVYFIRVARAAPGVAPDPAAFSAPQRIEVIAMLRDGQGGAIGSGDRPDGGGRIRLR